MSQIVEAELSTRQAPFEGLCGTCYGRKADGPAPYLEAVKHVEACEVCRTWVEQVASGEVAEVIAAAEA